MEIKKEKIKEFQKIYKEKFGKNISKEEAREQGGRLLLLLQILIKNK